jgi:hypothetical protein
MALDGVAAAIRGASLTDLLATEEELGAAVADAARLHEGMDSHELGVEVTRARGALDTCRLLGGVVLQVSDASLLAQGRGGEYNRAGSSTALEARGAGVQARV